jgi:hypothetical protein
LFGKWLAQRGIGCHGTSDTAGPRTAEPARQRHLFVHPQPQPWPVGTGSAGGQRTLQHVSRCPTGDVLIWVRGERTAVACDLHDFDAWSRAHLGFDSVTWTF